MPPVMNRAPMMNRPMLNRPQVLMNRPQAPMNTPPSPMMGGGGGNMPQGIAAILAGMAAKNPQGQMPQVGQQLPGSPINPELRNQEYLKDLMRAAQTMGGQMGGQMGLGQAMGSPLQTGQLGSNPVMMPATYGGSLGSSPLGAVFDPSLSNNPMQTASPLGGMMGFGQAMGGGMQQGGYPMDYMAEPGVPRPQPGNQQAPTQRGPMTEQDWNSHLATALYAPGTDFEKEKARFLSQPVPQLGGPLGGGVMQTGQLGSSPMYGGGLPFDSTSTTTQQDMMGGNKGSSQTNMASNLAQMFNRLGGQQPAQQGGTPLQNNSSPLQQSAQPVMNMGVM